MPRPRNVIPVRKHLISIPEHLGERLELALYSSSLRQVPPGAYKAFFTARIEEFFGWKQLDLEAYGFPSGYFIRGPKAMVEAVRLSLASRRPEIDPIR